jgi:hypothetical protein
MDLSIIQGPVSVAPCQTLILNHDSQTFASLYHLRLRCAAHGASVGGAAGGGLISLQ